MHKLPAGKRPIIVKRVEGKGKARRQHKEVHRNVKIERRLRSRTIFRCRRQRETLFFFLSIRTPLCIYFHSVAKLRVQLQCLRVKMECEQKSKRFVQILVWENCSASQGISDRR
uniref:Putative homeodomain transcription factor 2 n=1 Tax=Schistocephalus solidus TaxID=70667 RepID=A0A0X3NYE8_SCHSO